jgi:hypothetical protein
MRITRIYTGTDGQSHFEDLDIPLKPVDYGSVSQEVPASGIIFRETPAVGVLDFHPAPRRQVTLTIIGEVELECGDGTKRRLKPGDILLADDTSGQGHISREINGPRRSIFIPVPADFDISAWRVAKA